MEPYPIPKEIWFLVDHLYRHGLKKQNLFLLPGLHSELLAIRNWLDNGSSEPLRKDSNPQNQVYLIVRIQYR